jgi:hypothetical protein
MVPRKQAGHMTCTRPKAERQIPLAPRASSTHDPIETSGEIGVGRRHRFFYGQAEGAVDRHIMPESPLNAACPWDIGGRVKTLRLDRRASSEPLEGLPILDHENHETPLHAAVSRG